ncbi:MAG: RsmE family RNA methyltransferase, partial [Massilia sp.]|nr:RsmE family RNA methyltransferase [Massilia sp.]
ADASLAQWTRTTPPQEVTLLVGPEGGFTDQEEEAALAAGALALSMGPRVLRTETAGLAALAILAAGWDGI